MLLNVKVITRNIYLALRGIIFSLFYLLAFRIRRTAIDHSRIKNILVIALFRIGDTIVSVPTFRAIKDNFPRSRLTVFTDTYVEDIFERIPYVDKIVTYSSSSFFKQKKLIRYLSNKGFDLAVDLTCDYTFKGALLAYLSKATYRIGYGTCGRGFLFNKIARRKSKKTHIIEELLAIVESIDVSTKDKSLAISASDESKREITGILSDNNIGTQDILIGIHPGAYYKTQCWPAENFAAVARKITTEYPFKLALIGAKKEEFFIRKINDEIRGRAVVFLDKPLRELIAVIERCDLLLCNNSGPLHIAVAVGTPTVSLIGPAVFWRWEPKGKGHIVIKKSEGSGLRSTIPEEVFTAIKVQLEHITK